MLAAKKMLKRLRIDDPGQFRLATFDCADTCGIDLDKDAAKAMLDDDVKRLFGLQERLYADHRVVTDRTVDAHVKNLRRKLEEVRPGQDLVRSIYGVGYALEL